MPYITREDGEHFVIPSYRDVLSAKTKNALKSEILQLSQNYGEYITMQKKGPLRFEVAFSPDTGYLLGETVWYRFKRPQDMIYCEAVPNTTEAILVIVKSGSVYLDGRFPLDSIPEELVIFLTQENSFEIYTYGDVPIAQSPEDGKFSFESKSVKSYTVLDQPVFQNLPLLRIYQLRLVDPVLKSHGIGVFPFKETVVVLIVLGVGWMLWSYLTAEKVEKAPPPQKVNPYQAYITSLITPAPDDQIAGLLNAMDDLFTMPGWSIKTIIYNPGSLSALVMSSGNTLGALNGWAKLYNASVSIQQDGVHVSMNVPTKPRPKTKYIYKMKDVEINLIDRIAMVYPGNHIQIMKSSAKGLYSETAITINVDHISPIVIGLIGKQLKDLPLVLQTITLRVEHGSLSGTIKLTALGT